MEQHMVTSSRAQCLTYCHQLHTLSFAENAAILPVLFSKRCLWCQFTKQHWKQDGIPGVTVKHFFLKIMAVAWFESKPQATTMDVLMMTIALHWLGSQNNSLAYLSD